MSSSRCWICTGPIDDEVVMCSSCIDVIGAPPHDTTPSLDEKQREAVRSLIRNTLLDELKKQREMPKKCPHCGARAIAVEVDDKSTRSAMVCAECGTRGPWSIGKNPVHTARQLWDTLPR